MNLDFLKKIKNSLKVSHNTIPKQLTENGLRSRFLWNLLLIIYVVFLIIFILAIIFSYKFLTKDRIGAVDTNLNTTPKFNVSKIEKINAFFKDRENRIFSAYSKATIIDPWVN